MPATQSDVEATSDISTAWRRATSAHLESLGVDVDDYRARVVKRRFFESVSVVYWRAIADYAEKERPELCREGEAIDQALGRLLWQSRSTALRWMKDEMPPGGDKVLAALLIAVRKELKDLGFLSIREIAWRVVQRMLGLIRTEDLNEAPARLSRFEYECVRLVTRHPRSAAYLGRERETVVDRVHDDVRVALAPRFPEARRPGAVVTAVGLWVKPYTMFRVGLLPGGECADELAAT